MTEAEQSLRNSVTGWRIAVMAATFALVVALLGNAWLRSTQVRAGLPAEQARSPAFDIGNAENRHALVMLQGGEPGEWLGRHCDPTMPDSFRVTHLRLFDHGMDVRTALVVGGSSARVKYSDEPLPDRKWVAAWIDAAALKQLQAPLGRAGYPGALPPGVDSGNFCGETAMVDSCFDGVYYGVVRECPDDKVFPVVARVLDLAQAQAGRSH